MTPTTSQEGEQDTLRVPLLSGEPATIEPQKEQDTAQNIINTTNNQDDDDKNPPNNAADATKAAAAAGEETESAAVAALDVPENNFLEGIGGSYTSPVFGTGTSTSSNNNMNNDHDDDDDGPLILTLETGTANQEGEEEDEAAVSRHDTISSSILWFLDKWIHKWHRYVFVPVMLFIGTREYDTWEFNAFWWDGLFWSTTMHLIFLWMYLLLLPPPQHNHNNSYQPLKNIDLVPTYLTIAFVYFYQRIRFGYCYDSCMEPLQLGKFLWLSTIIQIKPYIFSNDPTGKQRFCFLLPCAVGSALAFEGMLTVALLLTTIYGIGLVAQYSGFLGWFLSKICPLLPTEQIRRLEINEEEKMTYEDEEELQAKVDQQIAQLGRPMMTNHTKYMDRGQETFVKAVAFLAMWVLIFVVSSQAIASSIEMATIFQKHSGP